MPTENRNLLKYMTAIINSFCYVNAKLKPDTYKYQAIAVFKFREKTLIYERLVDPDDELDQIKFVGEGIEHLGSFINWEKYDLYMSKKEME